MKPYILGLDGGGTKTMVCAIDRQGEELFRLQGGALNLNGESAEKVQDTMKTLIREAAELAGAGRELAAVGIGAAGISNPLTEKVLRAAVRQAGFLGLTYITGDHMSALAGAIEQENGILVIAGTGSICVGSTGDGRQARVGGRGHLIDDEGSGYAIGRDILRAVVRASDYREEATCLTEMVYAMLEVKSMEELVGYVYRAGLPKSEIAKLSKLLDEGCGKQDSAALAVSKKAAEQLVCMVIAAAEQLGLQAGILATAGSVLQRCRSVRQAFIHMAAEALPGFQVILPKRDAAYGAALLAMVQIEGRDGIHI